MQRILHLEGNASWIPACHARYQIASHHVRLFPVSEELQAVCLASLLPIEQPTFLVLTGHDQSTRDGSLHTAAFIRAVRTARYFQPDPSRLFIFAGACGSDAKTIQKAGANFASSPGRIPISILDPVDLILSAAALPPGEWIAPDRILSSTACGSAGILGHAFRVPQP